MCEKCTSELEEILLDSREDTPFDNDEYNAPISPILMGTDNLAEIEFCEDAFAAGVEDVSFTCGQLTALINVGLTPEDALQYIMNQEIIDSNYQMGILEKEKLIAIAKEHTIALEKNSI